MSLGNKIKFIPNWVKGSIIGLLIWFFDYDFLLNAGGPETPISNSIRNYFGVDYSNKYFPLIFLMFFGSIVAICASWIKKVFRR